MRESKSHRKKRHTDDSERYCAINEDGITKFSGPETYGIKELGLDGKMLNMCDILYHRGYASMFYSKDNHEEVEYSYHSNKLNTGLYFANGSKTDINKGN
jgi:hypothetical protein